MAYTECTVATDNISNLDDLPNDVGGLTAAQLKYMFDKFGAEFVTWFNATHLNELYTIAQKNYIIDGGFQVAQANPVVGTTVSNPANSTYPVCDMWKTGINNLSGTPPTTINHSQQLDSGETFYRVSPNGAGSGEMRYQIQNLIENGVRKLCGANKKVTVSFEAKSNISNKRLGTFLNQNYGTGGSPSSTETIPGSNFALTSNWTKYSFTFTTNTLSGKTFGTNNDDYLGLYFGYIWDTSTEANYGSASPEGWVGAGDIDIRRVKLEAGDVSTPFEQEPFAEVLQKCMRYYEKSYSYADKPSTNTVENMFITSVQNIGIGNGFRWQTGYQPRFKVSKRINPTITLYTYDGISGQWYVGGSNRICSVHNFKEGFNLLNNTGGTVTPTAGEVYGHYIADARY